VGPDLKVNIQMTHATQRTQRKALALSCVKKLRKPTHGNTQGNFELRNATQDYTQVPENGDKQE